MPKYLTSKGNKIIPLSSFVTLILVSLSFSLSLFFYSFFFLFSFIYFFCFLFSLQNLLGHMDLLRILVSSKCGQTISLIDLNEPSKARSLFLCFLCFLFSYSYFPIPILFFFFFFNLEITNK